MVEIGARPVDVSFWLDLAETKLDELYRVATTWASLDREERLDFVYEWSLANEYFNRLAEAESMSPAEWQRYQDLLRLRAERRPMLDWVLDEQFAVDPEIDPRGNYPISRSAAAD
jgi:hypothetical protein